MNRLHQELPYPDNSAALFACIADLPWAAYLDSGRPGITYGRYDILVADPFATLVTYGGSTEIVVHGHRSHSSADPFRLLQEMLRGYPATSRVPPFSGGALGYFAYDLARRLEHLPVLANNALAVPDMAIGLYDWAIVVDHDDRRAWMVGQGHDPRTAANWDALLRRVERPLASSQGSGFRVIGPVTSNMTHERYAAAFRQILDYIRAGDCYQVNLAQRFSAPAEGDAWSAYLKLRDISPAPFSAYLQMPGMRVLSVSPERFLRVHQRKVETKPIKGTRPRAADAVLDADYVLDLLSNPKDRAENLMIVDLLRNDIGKNCRVGSVRVDQLFALESYANVHHLVSTVSGELAEGRDAIDLLRGCFPGGSITGAPKLRAMQIIEQLEPDRRGVYCGAVGYIGFDGEMDTNIAIRTAVYSGGYIHFWAGGGIVADSDLEKEYRETWDKAAGMLQLMEICRVGG